MTNGLLIKVRISPGASKNQFLGYYGESEIKIAIKSPPVDGKANSMLLNFIAESFSVSKKNVELISGESSRSKKVFITDNSSNLSARLAELLSKKT